MKLRFIVLLFLAAVTAACNTDGDTNNVLENSDSIRVDEDLFSNAPRDGFEVMRATIAGNNLNITIGYGGGCGDVYYDLVAAEGYLDADPIQKNIRLAFDDQDNCEAGIERRLSFDLTQLQIPSTNTIMLNLDGWDDQIEYTY